MEKKRDRAKKRGEKWNGRDGKRDSTHTKLQKRDRRKSLRRSKFSQQVFPAFFPLRFLLLLVPWAYLQSRFYLVFTSFPAENIRLLFFVPTRLGATNPAEKYNSIPWRHCWNSLWRLMVLLHSWSLHLSKKRKDQSIILNSSAKTISIWYSIGFLPSFDR